LSLLSDGAPPPARPRRVRLTEPSTILDLIVVGAGPAGLAVSIAATQRKLVHEVLEKGVLVNSIFHFPAQMTFFTTPELLEIGGLPFVTPYEKPTRPEALRYYRRVADSYSLPLALGEDVRGIESRPEGGSPLFVVRTEGPSGPRTRRSRAVAIATGYYDHPNPLGIPGEELPHVSHYYGDAHALYRKKVVVVGGKNSAAIAALELYRAGAQVVLVHRRETLGDAIKYWIRPDIENRIKEGSVRALYRSRLLEIRPGSVLVLTPEGETTLPADAVLLLTGYRPDVGLLQGAGVAVDPETLKPTFDPATFESNVRGLYLAGAIVSGRETNRIFIENGRFHGETIARSLEERLAREHIAT
jgi:thioredoxin reductase (NADPH)